MSYNALRALASRPPLARLEECENEASEDEEVELVQKDEQRPRPSSARGSKRSHRSARGAGGGGGDGAAVARSAFDATVEPAPAPAVPRLTGTVVPRGLVEDIERILAAERSRAEVLERELERERAERRRLQSALAAGAVEAALAAAATVTRTDAPEETTTTELATIETEFEAPETEFEALDLVLKEQEAELEQQQQQQAAAAAAAVAAAGYYGMPRGGPLYYNPFDPYHFGAAAAAMPPVVVQMRANVLGAVRQQVEYYFSPENLVKDAFMRKQMDAEGFIPLVTIAGFNRVRTLTQGDATLVIEALQGSSIVEVSTVGDKLRKRGDWHLWLPPSPSNANSDTERTISASQPDQLFALDEEQRAKPDIKSNVDAETAAAAGAAAAPPNKNAEDDSDVLDEDLAKLVVVMRDPSADKGGRGIAGSAGRSPSGGNDDLASVINDGIFFYENQLSGRGPRRKASHPGSGGAGARNFEQLSLGGESMLASSPSTTTMVTGGRSMGSGGADSAWRVDGSNPPVTLGTSPAAASAMRLSGQPPGGDEAGFKHLKYVELYDRCMAERERAVSAGNSEDMKILFHFWCYFLRTRFNRKMYKDFLRVAKEDVQKNNSRYGLECLFRFYSYGLEKKFREDVYADFEQITLEDYNAGSLYGLEKYWAYHFYNRSFEKPPIREELKKLLDHKFKTLEHFRQAQQQKQQ
mmetsp:Transcript_25160/g.82548  ORF Transcript_25160/g.82548 Transcript_25160/m.82548 type:complete len:697 (-) Transcript_25160:430-2520(-)